MSIEVVSDIRQAMLDARDETAMRGESWAIYDSQMHEYEYTFSSVLDGRSVQSMVEERAEETGGSIFAIDLFASTAALSSLSASLERSSSGVVMEGLATGLTDTRNEVEAESDAARGVAYVHGNVLHASTRLALRNAVKARPADFIFERAFGGLLNMPKHKKFYQFAFDALWSMLAPNGGQMLLQMNDSLFEQSDMPTTTEIARALRYNGIHALDGNAPERYGFTVMYVRRSAEDEIERPSSLLRGM